MNISNSEGETSCKRQENGDVSAGSERPLKKARFAWQVKGKYHLRNQNSDISPTVSSFRDSKIADSSSESDNDSNDLVGNTEQNLEILGDYLLKQDFNTIDSVITDSDKSHIQPCTTASTARLSYPRYIGTYQSKSNTNQVDQENLSIPLSMVHEQLSFSEDQCIARWQARQMAKGFVDNTINRVLDSWMVAPMPADITIQQNDNHYLALDVAEFINNLPCDNSIENEGILMAISAHGLQNTSSSSIDVCRRSDQIPASSSSKKTNVFPSPPSSPISSDTSTNQFNKTKKNEENCCETVKNSCSCDDNIKILSPSSDNEYTNQNQLVPFNMFPDASESSSENDESKNNYFDANTIPHHEDIFSNHFDFMDAAVSFAIQNKGLTSFSSDYG